MDWPTFNELSRIAPTATISCLLVYFGWWLRGHEVKTLKEWIAELRGRNNSS